MVTKGSGKAHGDFSLPPQETFLFWKSLSHLPIWDSLALSVATRGRQEIPNEIVDFFLHSPPKIFKSSHTAPPHTMKSTPLCSSFNTRNSGGVFRCDLDEVEFDRNNWCNHGYQNFLPKPSSDRYTQAPKIKPTPPCSPDDVLPAHMNIMAS